MTTESFGAGIAAWTRVKSKPKPKATPRSDLVWMSENSAYLVLQDGPRYDGVNHSEGSPVMTDITRHHTAARMSQIVIHGDTIYLAGQVGNRGDSVADQTRTCLEKVEALLGEAGSDATRILQCTIWLADMADFAEMNEMWDSWVPEGHAPARACGEAKLAHPELKVELLVTAAVRKREGK